MRTRSRFRGGGPKFQDQLPTNVRRLACADWPAADRARWLRAQIREDPFDDRGTLVDLAPATIRNFEGTYGQFLSWLDSVGELDPDTPLEDRVTRERVGRFILDKRERCRASTIHLDLQFLKAACRAMAPGHDWSWIRRHPLAPTAQEVRASRKPIKQVDGAAILGQGRRMMDEAEQRGDELRAAMDFRNGLLLVFQALFTLRLGNLAEIVIGEHLVRRGKRWFLQFQETVKNKADLDYEVPGWLVAYLDTYLTRHRPILLGERPDHHRLWVCDDGYPLRQTSIDGIFTDLCRTVDGQKVTTHPFRHAKATAFMLRDPGNLELAAAALGHNGVSSVNQVYDRSGGIAASRAWNAIKRKRFGRLFDDDRSNADNDNEDRGGEES